ncbi:MAG TPA: endopeptidase La [Thermoanaerobaculia bacterium]|nr:endopeptidase La [Thermoanaerobaculia bacterium]
MSRRHAPEPDAPEQPLPVLVLTDGIVFPFITAPLTVTGERQQAAADAALAEERLLFLVAPRRSAESDPEPRQLWRLGTVAAIHRLLRLPDGRLRLLVQGVARARSLAWIDEGPLRRARIRRLREAPGRPPGPQRRARLGLLRSGLERLGALGRPMSPEVVAVAQTIEAPGRLADLVASHLDLRPQQLQELLAELDPWKRVERVAALLDHDLAVLGLQLEMAERARDETEQGQREFLLRQQLREIQRELGDGDELAAEVAGFRRLAEERGLPPEARAELERQVRRLERSPSDSGEAQVVRTYLDWMTALPWSVTSPDRLDLAEARRVLDEDHCGLEPIKERLLEFLAVHQLNPGAKGPILCLVGPPGVGKTSLGRSMARALGRRFTRLSLGGVHDEAEIRGHRRTYVGALPGRLLQGLHQAGTSNPVFVPDEIDKLGADHRGDPAAALLEVLDPEQNNAFRDHYLGLPYDLSRVLFLTTANLLDPILPAFLDRMEVLRLPGYAFEEKLEIARRHLVPRALAAHGLASRRLRFSDAALAGIVREYTREAGVRELERQLAAICRKLARRAVAGESLPRRVEMELAGSLLGPPPHLAPALPRTLAPGAATGLAWTAAGGEILLVEARAVPGRTRLTLTGQLGEVMRESAQAALTLVRASTAADAAATAFFAAHDLHVHVPAGATPKDGPSAGVTVAVALHSLATGRAADPRVALTGELTLGGELLPVGGIREKLLAARAAGVHTVVLPLANRREAELVPATWCEGLALRFVERFDEAVAFALAPSGAAS